MSSERSTPSGPAVRTLVDGREIVQYLFPLASERIVCIELPREPLSVEDAERLGEFIKSLVTQPEPDELDWHGGIA